MIDKRLLETKQNRMGYYVYIYIYIYVINCLLSFLFVETGENPSNKQRVGSVFTAWGSPKKTTMPLKDVENPPVEHTLLTYITINIQC